MPAPASRGQLATMSSKHLKALAAAAFNAECARLAEWDASVLHIVMKPALHGYSQVSLVQVVAGSIPVWGTGFISQRAPHSCPRVRCADLHVVDGPSIHHGDRPAHYDLQSHGMRASPRLEGGLGGLPHH